MADISMCADNECPSRGECHRWCAWPNGMRQSYADFGRQKREEWCASFETRWPSDRTAEQAEADVVKT